MSALNIVFFVSYLQKRNGYAFQTLFLMQWSSLLFRIHAAIAENSMKRISLSSNVW